MYVALITSKRDLSDKYFVKSRFRERADDFKHRVHSYYDSRISYIEFFDCCEM